MSMSIFKVAKLYNIKLAQLKLENYNLLRDLSAAMPAFIKQFPTNQTVLNLNYKINKLLQDIPAKKVDILNMPARISDIAAAFHAAYKSTESEAKRSDEKTYEWGNNIVDLTNKINKLSKAFPSGFEPTPQETAKWKGKKALPVKPPAGSDKSLMDAYNKAYADWAEEWKENVESKDAQELMNYSINLKNFDPTTAVAFRNWLLWFYPSIGEQLAYMDPNKRKSQDAGGLPEVPDPRLIPKWKELVSKNDIVALAEHILELRKSDNPNQSIAYMEWLKKNHPEIRKAIIYYVRQEQRRVMMPEGGKPAAKPVPTTTVEPVAPKANTAPSAPKPAKPPAANSATNDPGSYPAPAPGARPFIPPPPPPKAKAKPKPKLDFDP